MLPPEVLLGLHLRLAAGVQVPEEPPGAVNEARGSVTGIMPVIALGLTDPIEPPVTPTCFAEMLPPPVMSSAVPLLELS